MGECVTRVLVRCLVHTTDLTRCFFRNDNRSNTQKTASLILKQSIAVPLAKIAAKTVFSASIAATGGIVIPTMLTAGVYVTAGALPDIICNILGF